MTLSRFAAGALVPLFLLTAGIAFALPVRTVHVEAELVSESAAVAAGNPFWAAVRLKMDPQWHVYWRNPGDAGLPTTVSWRLPPGFAADPLLWPLPQKFLSSGTMTYGYDGEVLLLARITPPPGLAPGGKADLAATVSFLACKIECIPGKADLSLELPVMAGTPPVDPRWSAQIENARAALPGPDTSARFSASVAADSITLSSAGLSLPAGSQAYFYPESENIIASSAPQNAEAGGGGFSMKLSRVASAGSELPQRFQGILSVSSADGTRAFSVDVPLARGAAGSAASLPLLLAIAFAFIGGLILNLMPCVLPVLSLKVMGFVREAHSSPRRSLAHGLVFTAGVLVSFWILFGVLLALRAGGNLLGWGFQFQNPAVVVVMAALIFLLGLNMFGVFELGTRAASVGAGLRGRGGFSGSFFTGFLATVVATPCTAPFMGSALGFALAEPLPAAFSVFTALGLGMAAPSLVLSASPRLLARVPKPGKWTETLKQALGFLMMATVVWLGSVLATLAGAQAVTFLLGGLAVCGLGAWIYGRWASLDRPLGSRITASVLALLLVVGGAAVSARIAAGAAQHAAFATPQAGGQGAAGALSGAGAPQGTTAASGSTWEPFSAARLAELRLAGSPVLIDFSAQWCLTCKVNERIALQNPAVESRLKELDVATLKADWTDRNDEIAQALAGYGRSGVPLYVLYYPGTGQPKILPEILTPGIVLSALDGIPARIQPTPAPGGATGKGGQGSWIGNAFGD